MSDKKYIICPDCDGEGGIYLSCCGDELDSDLDLCPTCMEHCGEGDFEACNTCNGYGHIHPAEYKALTEREPINKKPEKLELYIDSSLKYSEAETAILKAHFDKTGILAINTSRTGRVTSGELKNPCCEILGNESLPFADLRTPKYIVEKNKGKDIFIKTNDRNKKVQNFSIHKSQRLLDIQNKK